MNKRQPPPSAPRYFPDPRLAESDRHGDGILAWGAMPEDPALQVDVLRDAYDYGIFPWPVSMELEDDRELPIPWVCPDPRAILEFSRLKWPRSLLKFMRARNDWRVTMNQSFGAVVAACGNARKPLTWITPEMLSAYQALHRAGDAHSVEVWNAKDQLIGGLYGVSRQGCFAGESMFHLESNASKVALFHLVQHLAARQVPWIDIQQLTPHLEAVGAHEITRANFLTLLASRQTEWHLQGSPQLFTPAPKP